jgi:ketosteroid isomerase-like protein
MRFARGHERDTAPVSANVELVKSIFAAWAEGDYSSADWADPEIELIFADGPAPDRAKGLAGMVELWRSMLDAWVDLRAIPESFHELDDGRVLVFLRNEGRGRSSGIDVQEISIKSANLFEFREGKVAKLVLYWERQHAVDEVGFPPQGGSSAA